MRIDQELGSAINAGEIDRVRALLKKGANVNSCHEGDEGLFNITPLMLAARRGNLEILNLLLERGAALKAKDRHVMPSEGGGEIALFYAVRAGHIEIARRLVQAGSPVNAKAGGTTPLGVALEKKNVHLAKALVEIGAKPSSAMYWPAISNQDLVTLRFLGERGVDPNLHDKDFGYTPLMEAARNGLSEICELLLKHGADPNARSHQGDTALMNAAEGGIIVQLQTEEDWARYGGDPRLDGSCLRTGKKAVEIIELLVLKGADINQRNDFGWTALMVAVYEKRSDTRDALLRLGASSEGVQVAELFRALQDERSGEEIYELAHKIKSLAVRWRFGQALWEWTWRSYKSDMIRMFVQMGMDPNMTAGDGDPLIKKAIQSGEGEFVKFLVEHGANLRAKDARGGDAAKWARGIKHMPQFIAHLLKERSAPEPVVKNFEAAAKSGPFQAALKELEERLGEAKRLRNDRAGGYEFSTAKARELVAELHESFVQRRAFLFESRRGTHVAILATADKYDVIRFMQTSAPNYNLDTEDIAEWLQRFEADHPFLLTGVGGDFIRARFVEEIPNARKVAKKLYEFCPDMVDQGAGTVANAAKILKESHEFYLWWD